VLLLDLLQQPLRSLLYEIQDVLEALRATIERGSGTSASGRASAKSRKSLTSALPSRQRAFTARKFSSPIVRT
jgi:hypothetical protein